MSGCHTNQIIKIEDEKVKFTFHKQSNWFQITLPKVHFKNGISKSEFYKTRAYGALHSYLLAVDSVTDKQSNARTNTHHQLLK